MLIRFVVINIVDASTAVECMFRHVLHHVTTSHGHLFAFAFSRHDGTCLTFLCYVTNSSECLSARRSDDDWDLFVKADAALEGSKIRRYIHAHRLCRFTNLNMIDPAKK